MIKKINDLFRKKLRIGIARNYPYRSSTEFAKRHFRGKNNLVCVEIGTWEGDNALNTLEKLGNIKKFYLIDPWEEYGKYAGDEKNNECVLNKALARTENKLKIYKNKIKIIRKYSDDALQDIPNNVDFIYIDGNHSYKYAKNDMLNYYEKLRSGGILAGHDIESPDVTKAFCEFVSEKGIDPIIQKMDWIIIKP